MAMMEKIMRPLPLSCLAHGVVILALCVLAAHNPAVGQEPKAAEVVMEVTPEEMPERAVPREASFNPFAEDSVWQKISRPAERLPDSEMPPASADGAATGTEAAGSQAVLNHSEAVSGGDGVVATGAGNPAAAAGGGAASGGDTGHYAPGQAGHEESAAAPAASPPTESAASIASRFAARVEANKEYPYMAARRGLTGMVKVTATLAADGSLENAYVSGSSGESLLDNAALAAVRNACPFPHGAARSITLTIPLQFNLQ